MAMIDTSQRYIIIPTDERYAIFDDSPDHIRIPYRQYVTRCRVQHKPVVCAYQHGKYARVIMDILYVANSQQFTNNPEFSTAIMSAIERITHKPYTGLRPVGIYVSIDRVPADTMTWLMTELLAIFDSYDTPSLPHP